MTVMTLLSLPEWSTLSSMTSECVHRRCPSCIIVMCEDVMCGRCDV